MPSSSAKMVPLSLTFQGTCLPVHVYLYYIDNSSNRSPWGLGKSEVCCWNGSGPIFHQPGGLIKCCKLLIGVWVRVLDVCFVFVHFVTPYSVYTVFAGPHLSCLIVVGAVVEKLSHSICRLCNFLTQYEQYFSTPNPLVASALEGL